MTSLAAYAAATGQVTLIAIEPRRSSTRISEGAVVDGIATGTKGSGGADFGAAISGSARCSSITSRAGSPASLIQRLARLALTPWAIETAAMETPGLAAGGNDLSLEFVAVLAAAPAQDGRLIFDSVHESTEKLSGLEAPMPSTGNQYGMAGCLLTDCKPSSPPGRRPAIASILISNDPKPGSRAELLAP